MPKLYAYTDGACSGNPGPGGWGVLLLAKDGETTKGGICPLSKTDLLEKRAAIFEKLGYTMLLENDKKWRLIAAPKSFMPF